MSYFTIENVAIKGISSVVPSEVYDNVEMNPFESEKDAKKFVSVTGIKQKRHVAEGVCTSDLCYKAAEDIISKLDWKKEEIDVLIMVTQTPDYIIPNTSIIMQDRLGLSKDIIAFDLTLGCSGFVYGLSVISNFLSSGKLKKGLLLVGETLSKQCSELDKTTFPLFGDAGTATALEYKENSRMQFDFWADGSGHKKLYIPHGGYRNRLTKESLDTYEDKDGNIRSSVDTYMDGGEVFTFGITKVPTQIQKFFKHFSIDVENIDFGIFHQANKFMIDMIRKKAKFNKQQVLYSLHKYGNTGSATIPLTISHNCIEKTNDTLKLFMCGFGIGLSIGMVYLDQENEIITLLDEYDQ